MRRALYYLLLGFSSLLLLATAYLWFRSHRANDLIQYTRHIDIDRMNIIEEGYQYSSANSGLSIAYSNSHLHFRSDADATRVRGYLRGAIMDGRFRANWMIIPWRQYGGANGQGFRDTVLGFQSRSQEDRRRPSRRSWIIIIPWALPFVIFAILPALALRRFVKTRHYSRRRQLGLCLSCGYDLRQLTSSICPECGVAYTPPTTQATG